MFYVSTRGDETRYTAAEAILKGIAVDGGLLVPEEIPQFSEHDIEQLKHKDFSGRVAYVLARFLSDYTESELLEYSKLAYSEEKFGEKPCPLVQLNKYNNKYHILELWHGPTAAFKDMALQLLPYLMTAAIRKTGETAEVIILTATSGDTGKAALEGFKNVPGTRVVVYYPKGGVSKAQELQMLTTEGDNCQVIAVEGSFDDAQSGVKQLFSDRDLSEKLALQHQRLSSANSINWGRLAPQIAYYWSAYVDLLNGEKIQAGDLVNFSVPTGNFGNILAAWYANQMGLPIGKLICASNRNNVLSDFLAQGTYNAKREFFMTLTPSMDILVSSNLERLLFELSYQNPAYIKERMEKLQISGSYSVGPEMMKRLHEKFVGGFTDDRGAIRTIQEVYDEFDHVIDPHTAVAFNVYRRYEQRSKDETAVVFVSTASPFKFPATVCKAIFNMQNPAQDELSLLRPLSDESGLEIPEALKDLDERPILHHKVVRIDDMKQDLIELLSI